MSKIFDALQRSEGERSGNESATLPHGPELLREAERRAASSWEAIVSTGESANGVTVDNRQTSSPEAFSALAASITSPYVANLLSAGERVEILNQFQTLPVSVLPESHLACITDRKSPAAEAVRLLALRLRDLRRTRPLKKVVITSTIPQEGKSTISANLSCAFARRTEEKVLLVEGDIRLPAALQMFGIERKPGLCELLRDERVLADCVYRLGDTGLYILPAGVSANNPLELLQSPKLSSALDQLSACFDWIVIDSPPVLPLADTSVWMRLADGVLLVTRQGVTEKKQLKKGLDALEPQKVLGALLNGSNASRYSEYYYGDSDRS
jgi:capsular exopolysaccharide synthesis family protein